ncbi:MAG: pilus assembly protein TadG-related protein [Acidobacteria bacterium]|nr:pilus assembly protein TadG-related protein [Acidobacteriota bacterium]
MNTCGHANCKRHNDRGVSILIIAVSMVFILGMAGLGIDLASLYVGRSQAQRAADAGALAAAQYLADWGCTAGSGSVSADCQAVAKQHAVAVTNSNLIAGVSPNITTSDVTFIQPSANDPQVQVIAGRDMPTFFVKIFGINSAKVSATAVAEAFNPAGGGPPVGATCLKPWLMPNCDWDHAYSKGYDNAACFGDDQFIDTYPPTVEYSTTLVNPGPVSQGGVQGEEISIKSQDPSKASGPSQFYPVYLPPGQVASECPSCATSGGGGGTGASSGAYYEQNIECCNTTEITCGSQTIQPITGDKVGVTASGVDCLIHEQGGSGQDIMTINPSGTLGNLWTITAGSNNPYGYSGALSSSDSIVTLPMYDGTTLCPGGSCPSQATVTVNGYLQLFIIGTDQLGNVNAYVMNVIPCPGSAASSGSGGTPAVSSGGSSPVPVRLIHE